MAPKIPDLSLVGERCMLLQLGSIPWKLVLNPMSCELFSASVQKTVSWAGSGVPELNDRDSPGQSRTVGQQKTLLLGFDDTQSPPGQAAQPGTTLPT